VLLTPETREDLELQAEDLEISSYQDEFIDLAPIIYAQIILQIPINRFVLKIVNCSAFASCSKSHSYKTLVYLYLASCFFSALILYFCILKKMCYKIYVNISNTALRDRLFPRGMHDQWKVEMSVGIR
jgi:hypothetical protein